MNEKPPLDDDWLEIANDWQSQPYEPADIDKISKTVKWKIIKSKLLFGLNIFLVLGIYCMTIYAWLMEWSKVELAYLLFGCIGGIYAAHREYTIRKGTWRYTATTPEEVIDSAIQSYRASIKYCDYNIWGSLIVSIGGIWFITESAKSADKSPIMGIVVYCVLMLMIVGICWHVKKKRQKTLSELELKVRKASN